MFDAKINHSLCDHSNQIKKYKELNNQPRNVKPNSKEGEQRKIITKSNVWGCCMVFWKILFASRDISLVCLFCYSNNNN